MNVHDDSHADLAASRIAAAIGEPARARILYSLMDGHARTSTELSAIAEVTPSTASAHLSRLTETQLVKVMVQGKHRYYSLAGPDVAAVLEGLSVLAGGARPKFTPSTPNRLREARTCYDHLAGTVGVRLHDHFVESGFLSPEDHAYELTPIGARAFALLGVDVEETRALRRRFASACLDWSERRPHLGGALGAAVLKVALKKKWLQQELDSRALTVTRIGRRELLARFSVET